MSLAFKNFSNFEYFQILYVEPLELLAPWNTFWTTLSYSLTIISQILLSFISFLSLLIPIIPSPIPSQGTYMRL